MCLSRAAFRLRFLLKCNSWLSCLAGGFAAALLWFSLADTPFLQDDYGFLYEAKAARDAGHPLAILSLATGEKSFWRPVSVGLHWRLVADVLQGSPLAAHLLGIFLTGLAAASVARFSLLFIEHFDMGRPGAFPGFLAGFAYGVHGAHFMPVAWASAVQETYAILWSALALLALMRFCHAHRPGVAAAFISVLALVLALLSKEGTVVLPFLAIVISATIRTCHRHRWYLPFVWSVVAFAWILGRSVLVSMPEAGTPYALTMGPNIIKNAVLAVLFMLNLPREAILLWMIDRSFIGIIWGAVCLGLQCLGLGVLLWSCRGKFRSRHMVVLPVMSVIALLPYLPLYSQAYSYYTLLALIPYAVLVCYATILAPRRALLAMFCAFTSTVLLIAGQRLLPYPAPVARAQWAKSALASLDRDAALQRQIQKQGRLHVYVEDNNRFAALGYASGLALVFSLKKMDVILEHEVTSATQLQVSSDGLYF